MGHGKLVRNPVSGWTTGSTILSSEIASLDAGLTLAVDGDGGGTYAPNEQIQIAGAGMPITGPLVVARGGELITTSDASALTSPTITCADGDWPEIDQGGGNTTFASRTRSYSLLLARGSLTFVWTARREFAAIQAFSPMYDLQDGIGMRTSKAYARLRGFDSATLSQLTVHFKVGWPHAALPTTMPSVRVLRIDAFGNAVSLTSVAAGGDANGFVYAARPATPAAWYANGAAQAIVVPCNQNNAIDCSQYDYVVEIVEEQGLTGYPWCLTYISSALCATTTAITLSGTQTIDGVPVGVGDQVLVKNQGDPQYNGLYIVSSGAWSRSSALNAGSQMTQGMVASVLSGSLNGDTFWQLQSQITSWTPNGTAAGTPLTFLPMPDVSSPAEGSGFFAHGLIWLSMQPVFSAIADLRPT